MKVLTRLKFMLQIWRFIPFMFDFFLSKEVSIWQKVIPVLIVLIYVTLPFDLIPDFFAIFGVTDDIAITTFILQRMIKIAPDSIKEKYKLDGPRYR